MKDFILSHLKFFIYGVWAASAIFLIGGLMLATDPQLSPSLQIVANILIQAGGAFFFALTVGWVIDRVRDEAGYSALWLFSQEFRKAGVLAFYSDRKDTAEESLKEAFKKHTEGEVLMAGASLRFFLAHGHPFYSTVEEMLCKRGRVPIIVKAISCDPENNHELPVRSFVEEFNQDRTFREHLLPFDWKKEIDFSFDEFEKNFFEKHGIHTPVQQQARVILDLQATRTGVMILHGKAENAGNSIDHRQSKSAPYCTVIIFPDKAFYTPNLLCAEAPVNMPMIVFHRSSDIYKKLVNYVEFLWWVNNPGEV